MSVWYVVLALSTTDRTTAGCVHQIISAKHKMHCFWFVFLGKCLGQKVQHHEHWSQIAAVPLPRRAAEERAAN